MKALIVVLLCCLLCPHHVKSEICAHGGGETVETEGYASAVDDNGDVYVVGSLSTRGLFNDYSVTILGKSFGGPNVGIHDVGYIAKVNPRNQNTMYVKTIELIDYSELNQPSATINSIGIKNNKVMIAGSVSGQVDVFGCNVNAPTPAGGVFVAQLGLSGTCKKAIVATPLFTPFLLIDSATNHLYLYGSFVYGEAKFGDITFPDPGFSGSAAYIARMSWLKSYDWVVQMTNIVDGELQYISPTQDIAQDDDYVYTVVQGSGILQFCNQDMECTQTALAGYQMVLVKLDKADGSVSVVLLESDATEFSVTTIGARSRTATKSEIYVASIGREATVGKYNQDGAKQWQTSIPNHCCTDYRRLQSSPSRILLDSDGTVYVSGTTYSGSGVRFAVAQPWVVKLRRTNGNILFNTRADMAITEHPPSPYSYAGAFSLDDEEGEIYLPGAYGCTLKFEGSPKKLTTIASSCGSANTPNGRNTWMYIASLDAGSGRAC